ncbi:TPA: redoxin domain-containing protein [Corynebacterium striatum]|uniref:redoxin domain-containing protein n=1 Tax=Corynebacterium striatum TaxID=43770 RepID=UPI000666EE12|nr:cytochrome c biogenesis protein CcdA [Corynebacterium striatum]EGT5574817.1 redoxin domain-containing protein [Corynebacterium striatum]EGT5788214.1 redoxin domain-containing protein [Corynebacterium striatum]KAA1271445.1 cytochrome c biogenesis protein DipZ [Corynebacterium striatum]MDK8812533.1 cytochrome c biogenesis protein CcdA [Corynebacterium striatum]NHX54123.1 redoxin domain-containing protein [Corynebacterium striatum]
MLSTLSIGLVGGLVTGLSPCILPILPLVLAVSGNGGRSRPWLVIGGLVTSFTAVTLFATTLLNALHLPGDLVWKVGIGLLVLVGLGMMFPKFQEILEWPFLKLPKAGGLQAKARDKGGFVVGLALGVVFVPCAGPVLAAISVAGATGTIDAHILILCLAFAVGVAIPLMAFALGGNEVGKRVDFFQSHQRGFRFGAGVVVIAMAGAIAVGAPAWLQQKLPSPEFGQEVLAKEASSSKAGQQVPEFQGLTGWFNTDEPVDPRTNGKVTLIDFWAYACINCQRNNVHLTKIYDHYKDSGLEVVGIHAPEYSFEREAANVQRAAREQGIHYPVAQDNDFTTWRAFENQYWPAHYLVDAQGILRESHHGEGDYAETENHIRELLKERDPNVQLPAPLESADQASTEGRNPETYLGTARARYFANRNYAPGTHDFELGTPERGQYSLGGTWTLEDQPITAGKDARLRLNYHAAWVQLVVSGKGTVTVRHADGTTREFPVKEDGTLDLVKENAPQTEVLDIEVSEGVKLYSFTFG